MSGKQYLKNQLPVLLLNLLGVLALALFLIATGTSRQAISFIALVWIVVVVCYLTVSFFIQKRHCETLLVMAEQLGEKYLMPEVMSMPERADEQVFYQILKMAEKSMLEKIGEIQSERQEYKEYIEQWIHEVKTPITAMKLICENNRSEFTRELLVEVENINRFTEQALYYARSEHTEKDYTVREIRLSDVIHDAIADSKYLLRKNRVAVEVEDDGKIAYMDDKWVRFILNQIISNSYENARALEQAFSAEYPEITDTGVSYAIRLSTLQVNTTKASNFVLQASMLYAAVVLMVICLTVLSLQQLLDASQYKYRFSVLRKLGVEDTHIGKLILKQLGIWFGLPIVVAIIVSTMVIIYFIQTISAEISAYIGFGALMSQIGMTVSILALLLICYFISTWLLFKKSIK